MNSFRSKGAMGRTILFLLLLFPGQALPISHGLEIMQRIGDETCASRSLGRLARVAQHDGDNDQAAEFLRRSLLGFKKLNRKDEITRCLARFAALAEIAGHNKRAARLLGAALKTGSQTWIPPLIRGELEDQVAALREIMGNEDFERVYAEGASMSLDEATAFALGEGGES